MVERDRPAYSLAEVKRHIHAGDYVISRTAFVSAAALGFGPAVIGEVVASLTSWEFEKSVRSRQFAGAWLDVYRPERAGQRLYVKIQIRGPLRVVSFK
jgi:motility quorum-sensing regulator/GCU-specific mRNA interferase toxin